MGKFLDEEIAPRGKFLDEETAPKGKFLDEEESGATIEGLLKQFTIGAINEAFLGAPLFALEKIEGEEARKELESQVPAERIARGVGTAVGFGVGFPSKVIAGGGRLALKFGPKAVQTTAKTATGVARQLKNMSKGQKLLRGAIEGAGGFGAYELLKAPDDEISEKLVTVPLATTLGSGLGVAGEIIKPIISRAVSNITKGRISVFTDELSHKVLTEVDNTKFDINRLIRKGKFNDAQKMINRKLQGRVQDNMQLELNNAIRLTNQTEVLTGYLPLDTVKELKTVKKNNNFCKKLTQSGRVNAQRQGENAKEIVSRADAAQNFAELRSGSLIQEYGQKAHGLSHEDRINFSSVAENKATSANNAVKTLHEWWTKLHQKFARESQGLDLSVRRRDGKLVPLKPVDGHFPHMILSPDSSKTVVKDMVDAGVKRGDFNTYEGGLGLWKDYSRWVGEGKRSQKVIEYVAKKNNITNTEAEKFLNTVVRDNRTRRFANLELAREVDLPFWDPNPDRVIPRYIEGVTRRIEEVKRFGKNDEIINELIDRVSNAGGDSRHVKLMFDRMTGQEPIREALDSFSGKASKLIRNFETVTKLGLAAIPNSTQSINTAFTAGVKNTLKGIIKAQTEGGKEFAQRTGGVLSSTIDDMLSRSSGGTKGFSSWFLGKVGFTATEKMNRTIAANAGREYVLDLTSKLIDNPLNRTARRGLMELGLSPDKILRRGNINFEEILLGAQKIINKSQFRSGVMDLPVWASSPEGKLMFQFKTFAFNQTKLIKDALLKEAARGNFKPIITAATLMPVLGEGVRDVKSVLTGKSRDKEGLERIAENIGAVGSLGIISDLWQSGRFNSVAEFIGGPAVSDISAITSGIIQASEGRPKKLQKTVTRNIPILGQLISSRIN